MSREQGGELSTSNLEKCCLLVFAARLFFRTATFESATFQITVYSFSRRDFFVRSATFESATFQITVYSFSRRDFFFAALLLKAQRSKSKFNPSSSLVCPPPISKLHFACFRGASLLVFVAPISKLQFTRFRPPSPSQSMKIIQKCFPITPKMFQKWCPKRPKSRKN